MISRKRRRREFGKLFSFAPLLLDFLKKKSCSFRTGKSAGAKSIPRDTWPTDEGSKMLSKRKSCKYLTFIKIAYPSLHAAPSKIVRSFSPFRKEESPSITIFMTWRCRRRLPNDIGRASPLLPGPGKGKWGFLLYSDRLFSLRHRA